MRHLYPAGLFDSQSKAPGSQYQCAHRHLCPEASINVRIGICAREPVEEDQRLFGSTVQLTSRICDKAHPDQILVASVVKDLCLGKSFTFADVGEDTLKGFDQPLRMYEVQWQG
jgi:adenylate cyclase